MNWKYGTYIENILYSYSVYGAYIEASDSARLLIWISVFLVATHPPTNPSNNQTTTTHKPSNQAENLLNPPTKQADNQTSKHLNDNFLGKKKTLRFGNQFLW